MSWFAKNLIGGLFLPPCNFLLIQATGVLLWKRCPRLSRYLVVGSCAGLALFSMPAISGRFSQLVENAVPPLDLNDPGLASRADAIVVLGGGKNFASQDYGGRDTVSISSLARVRYAADIRRKTGKPILMTGGAPSGGGPSEAELMGEVLQEEFGFKADWLEQRSDDTAENAEFSYRILSEKGIKRIFLVTHAWHMPRAYRSFKRAGFSVVPAATGFFSDGAGSAAILGFVPSSKGLDMSYVAFHEGLGALWYRIRGAE